MNIGGNSILLINTNIQSLYNVFTNNCNYKDCISTKLKLAIPTFLISSILYSFLSFFNWSSCKTIKKKRKQKVKEKVRG